MGKNEITLTDIAAIDKEFLTPADVAGYLGSHPYSINCAAKAGTLPWAYNIGSRTKIPKSAFLNYHRFGAVLINEDTFNGYLVPHGEDV